MLRFFSWVCVCIIAIGHFCPAYGMACKPGVSKPTHNNRITIFLTGNELSSLQPCGCSTGQLGGFDRRAAVLSTVAPGQRLIVDTGNLIENDGHQDLIKFNVIMQAFSMLDYDLVNLAEMDVEAAENFGLLRDNSFSIISFCRSTDANIPGRFTKQMEIDDKRVIVTIAAFDAQSDSIGRITELFTRSSESVTVNVLILNTYDTEVITAIGKPGLVDVVVCPADYDEPTVLSKSGSKPMIISVGRFGEYVGKLEIDIGDSQKDLEFKYAGIAVTEELPRDKSLVDLYRSYQLLVKEEKLLENFPRMSLPNGLEYTGSKSCKLCHEYEYSKWSSKGHARAYATLQKVGSEYDPECAICHTVGMRYEQGFISEVNTPDFKNVGCENCHGPGSEHLKSLGKAKTTGPKQDCTACHTPDQSVNYADNEEKYLKKIVHWREPNAPAAVKE